MIVGNVFIEPGGRNEAIRVWRDLLTPEQVEQIEEAPESAIVRLMIGVGNSVSIQIIEEG